jgi:hypothetical protein
MIHLNSRAIFQCSYQLPNRPTTQHEKQNKKTAAPARRAAAAPVQAGKELMMWEALREAVDEEMERDPTVCVMGEDVGHYGGSYKVTYGLYKKYGDMRVLDTPICGACAWGGG